jgi:hypothetical protein
MLMEEVTKEELKVVLRSFKKDKNLDQNKLANKILSWFL